MRSSHIKAGESQGIVQTPLLGLPLDIQLPGLIRYVQKPLAAFIRRATPGLEVDALQPIAVDPSRSPPQDDFGTNRYAPLMGEAVQSLLPLQLCAMAAGFAPVLSADGDVDDLIALVAAQPPAANLPLLYLAGSDRAGGKITCDN